MSENKVMRVLHRLGEIATAIVGAVVGVIQAVFGLDKRNPNYRDDTDKESDVELFRKTIPEDKKEEASILQTLHPHCHIACLNKEVRPRDLKGLGLNRDDLEDGSLFAIHDAEKDETSFIYISNDHTSVKECGGNKLCHIPSEFKQEGVTAATLTHTLLNRHDKTAPEYDANILCASRILRTHVCNKVSIRRADINENFCGQSQEQTNKFTVALRKEIESGAVAPHLLPAILQSGVAADKLYGTINNEPFSVTVGALYFEFEKGGANGLDYIRVHSNETNEQHSYAIQDISRNSLKQLMDSALIGVYTTGSIKQSLKDYEQYAVPNKQSPEDHDIEYDEANAKYEYTRNLANNALALYPTDKNHSVANVDVWQDEPDKATVNMRTEKDGILYETEFIIDTTHGTVDLTKVTCNGEPSYTGAFTHAIDPLPYQLSELRMIEGLLHAADRNFGDCNGLPRPTLFTAYPDELHSDQPPYTHVEHLNRCKVAVTSPEGDGITFYAVVTSPEGAVYNVPAGDRQDVEAGINSALSQMADDRYSSYAASAQVYANAVIRSELENRTGLQVSETFSGNNLDETKAIVSACRSLPYNIAEYIPTGDVIRNADDGNPQNVMGFIFSPDGNGGILATDTFTGDTVPLGSDMNELHGKIYGMLAQRSDATQAPVNINDFAYKAPEAKSPGYTIVPLNEDLSYSDAPYPDDYDTVNEYANEHEIDEFYDGILNEPDYYENDPFGRDAY